MSDVLIYWGRLFLLSTCGLSQLIDNRTRYSCVILRDIIKLDCDANLNVNLVYITHFFYNTNASIQKIINNIKINTSFLK